MNRLAPDPRAGRAEPYTIEELLTLACVCCGAPSHFQWNCCADGNLWRPLCGWCDIKINQVMLVLTNDPNVSRKIARYTRLTLRVIKALDPPDTIETTP